MSVYVYSWPNGGRHFHARLRDLAMDRTPWAAICGYAPNDRGGRRYGNWRRSQQERPPDHQLCPRCLRKLPASRSTSVE